MATAGVYNASYRLSFSECGRKIVEERFKQIVERRPVRCGYKDLRRHPRHKLLAISDQLQDYADDPLSDGFGIYLVFWFGIGAGATPNAPAGTAKPSSATELEQALIENLMPDQRNRFEVIVLDLEPPKNSLANGPADNRTADNTSADK